MKYRKKPVVIEAEQLTRENADKVAAWCSGRVMVKGRDVAVAGPCSPMTSFDVSGVDIATLEGVMRANIGDFIIKGVKGEFYPCAPDIFELTYEPANGAAQKGVK